MAIAPSIREILPMEVSMANYIDKAYDEFCDYVKETAEEFIKNHHL